MEYFEISELIATKLKFQPRPSKNKLNCSKNISSLLRANMQLANKITPPEIDIFFEPIQSTIPPNTGENTNIPRV